MSAATSFHPNRLEPLLLDGPRREREGLDDLALALEREAAALDAILPEPTRGAVLDMLRIANAYYSNRIEGHDTRPGAIERAMRDDFAEDPRLKALQREARAHVEVERLAEAHFLAPDAPMPYSADGLRWIHREFYERVPAEFRYVEDPVTGRRESIEPGALRTFDVTVGRHVPPPGDAIGAFLDHAAGVYDPAKRHGLEGTLAVAASHQRLLWIHPFGDGNGRVIRLATTLYARRIGLGGIGLWTPSRGLARRHGDYMASLEAADNARLYAADERGPLSATLLARFARFFLDVCLDQVRYMRSVLVLDALGSRAEAYARLRAEGVAPSPNGKRLQPAAGPILRTVLLRGEVSRGDAIRLAGVRLGERAARQVLAALLGEGLLVSASPKGALRVAFPSHATPYLFPDLYPEGVAADPATGPAAHRAADASLPNSTRGSSSA